MAVRKRKGPRKLGVGRRGEPYLWFRPGRIGTDGIERGGVWIIMHAGRQVASTDCGLGEGPEREALRQLEDYKNGHAIAAFEALPIRKGRPASQVLVAEALSRYLDAKKGRPDPDTGALVGGVARYEELAQRVETLLEWWGGRTLDDVDSCTCKAYVASRVGTPWKTHARLGTGKDSKPARRGHSKPTMARTVTEGGARRELEDLRASVNEAIRDGLTRDAVRVTLPQKSEARDRWLTKAEAARLVGAAWHKREVQTIHCGPRKGETYITPRRPSRHLARFILVALRTGTRSTPICQASFIPEIGKPWMELKTEVVTESHVERVIVEGVVYERRHEVQVEKRVALFHRKALGAAAKKNKRQPTVRMPDKLVAHLWRWHHVLGQRYVIEWQGRAVGTTKRAFANLVHDLGLGDDVVRHSLRHTAVTWGVQAGTDLWELSGYVGMTVEMIQSRYGHHATDHMEAAREAMGRGGRKVRKAA
ncbi:site-specific integrase [Methylobacterium sp. CM6244]